MAKDNDYCGVGVAYKCNLGGENIKTRKLHSPKMQWHRADSAGGLGGPW